MTRVKEVVQMGWEFMQEGTPYTNQICGLCSKPVKAGQRFYIEDKAMTKVVHAACAWDREEQRIANLERERNEVIHQQLGVDGWQEIYADAPSEEDIRQEMAE